MKTSCFEEDLSDGNWNELRLKPSSLSF